MIWAQHEHTSLFPALRGTNPHSKAPALLVTKAPGIPTESGSLPEVDWPEKGVAMMKDQV